MAQIFSQFKNWLLQQRDFLFSWISRDSKETQEPEESLEELPPSLRKKLIDATKNLPSNPDDIEAIKTAINEAFDSWRNRPQNSDNSIVAVSSPVTAVTRIIAENFLENWSKEKQISINFLSWKARPNNTKEIAFQLQHELKLGITKSDPKSLEVVVIPNLNWCFLRSLEGLGGIDYLQSLLLRDRFRFWIIGVGLVGWDYLNSVTNFNAYCGKVFSLPELTGESLKAWLNPVYSEFDLSFSQPNIDPRLLDDKTPEDKYFDSLASVSEGVSIVAVQAFLRSISYKSLAENKQEHDNHTLKNVVEKNNIERIIPDKIQQEARKLKEQAQAAVGKENNSPAEDKEAANTEESTESRSQNESEKVLQAEKPKLPDLPNLNSEDLYLLYSLLLHGDMTISALTESLGDEESKVQAQVQMLRRVGIVEEKERILQVNPIYYPKLKQELASNNFVINEID